MHLTSVTYHAVWWMSLSAINDEQIKAAVAYHNNRPPLAAMKGPAELVSFAVKLIPVCWHESPDERPTFDGKHNQLQTH